jgi:hypothetical protein
MTIAGVIGPLELVLILGITVLPMLALVDILRHEFSGNNKTVWILIVVFLPILGSILYFISGSKNKIK